LVVAAGSDVSVIASRALDDLCRMYWYPLYCYVRRRGYPSTDAEDLVQGLFAHLFERELFDRAKREKGRFRSFLLSIFRDFLIDQQKRSGALKRGGGTEFVPLDMEGAEARFSDEPAGPDNAESSLERAWAMELLQRATRGIGEQWRADGKGDLFDELSGYLLKSLDTEATRQIATRLGLSESNVKVSLTRLKGRYRDAIRREVAETVSSADEIDAEIAHLAAVVSR
jgi:RNA polymerase sigma-70 factor (ECF subfamily)